MGLVSQIASAWHGFDVQASSRWHSSPAANRQIPLDFAGSYWGFLQLQSTHCIIWEVVPHHLVGNYHLCFQGRSSSPWTRRLVSSATSDFIYLGTCSGKLHLSWRKRQQVPPKCCSHLHTTQHHITEGTLRPQYSTHSKSQISPSGSMESGDLLNKWSIIVQQNTHCSMDHSGISNIF